MTDGAALATILFTDLVGSTSLRAGLGEDAADQLRRVHDAMLSAAVTSHRGTVVKGSGDGILAAFASASDALSAAVAAQQALWQYNRRADRLAELSVRMGLSVGDVSWEGGDCFGVPVVEAARLEAAAGGATILCSDLVRALAHGRGAHRFVERGALTLKGLPEPVVAFEVAWDPPEVTGAALADLLPPGLAMAHGAAFVGRDDPFERIVTHLGAMDAFRLAWISGEPGIGKTRLAAAVASWAAEQGALVLLGRCDEDLAFPYQPFAEALRDFVAGGPSVTELGTDPTALARLAPALSALDAGIDPASINEADQRRLFEAVTSWLAAVGRNRPVVIVLDDLQWATGPTAQLVRFVARSLPAARLALVVTMRDTEADDGPASGVHDELVVRSDGLEVRLNGLGADAIRDLVGADEDAALELFDQTGGNPLFLTLLSGSGQDVPAAIRRRTRTLTPAARELLGVAAVVGNEWDLSVVAAAMHRPSDALLEDTMQLRRAGLLGELGVGRFRFGHALVRQALLDEAGLTRVALLHLRVADAIETVHGATADAVVAELAYHLIEARAVGADATRTAAALVRAGRLATYQFDHEAAVEHFRRARELLTDIGAQAGRVYAEAVLGEGEALVRTTDLVRGFERLTEAIERAEAGGWLDLAVPAALHHSRMSSWLGRPGGDSVALLSRVLGQLGAGDSVDRSLLSSELARSLSRTADAEAAPAVLAAALAMARRTADPRAQTVALTSHFHVHLAADQRSVRRRAMEEAVDIERRTGVVDPFARAACMQFYVELEAGNVVAARERLPVFVRTARAYRFFDVELLFVTAMLDVVDGAFTEAESCYERARELASHISGFDIEGIYGLAMFLLRRDQGRLHEVAGVLRMAARLGALDVSWQPGLAALYAALDLRDDARAVLDHLVLANRVSLPADSLLGGSLSLLADAVAAAGTSSQAETVYQALAPWAGGCIMLASNACVGPADRYLGMLAAKAGRPAEAERHFDAALALARRSGSPLWSAQAAVAAAEHLFSRGERDRAEALLADAVRTATALQLGGVLAHIARLNR